MTDVNHSDHPIDPGFDAPAAQGSGDFLVPDAGGVQTASAGPGDHLVPDAGTSVRPPSGSHLENWNESDTVEAVATRAPTGDPLTPDLP